MLIREKDKKNIVDIAFKTINTSSKILAFGSRVNGDAHEMSDLDLVVVSKNDEKLNIDELMNFKNSLRKSNIPIIVQVMDWGRIPKSFHNNILKNYEVMVEL